jgi:hypothetical protein
VSVLLSAAAVYLLLELLAEAHSSGPVGSRLACPLHKSTTGGPDGERCWNI